MKVLSQVMCHRYAPVQNSSSIIIFGLKKLIHRQEMVGKATLSQEDKKKITDLLNQENAVEFMSSEEREEDEEETRTGPPKRHVKPLQWERSKLRTIN